jgi:hypothetical protein
MKKPSNTNIQQSSRIIPYHYQHSKTPVPSVSDISVELRRNLIETADNVQDNKHLYEELNKFQQNFESMKKEQDVYTIVHSDNNNNNNNNCEDELRTSLEKLKENLTNTNTSSSCVNSVCNVKNIKKFVKYPPPVNKSHIKCFVMNVINYINYLMSLSIQIKEINYMKTKLETRYNDFRNKGLNKEYFKKVLIQMQDELILKIKNVLYTNNNNNNNDNDIWNEDDHIDKKDNYNLLSKKTSRKKSLSEMKSITSSSFSSEDSIL